MSKILCRKPAFAVVFMILLFACACSWSMVWAQAKSGSQTKTLPVPETPASQVTFDQLLADRYSCYGPMALESVTPKSLVFPDQGLEKGLQIGLAGKTVNVVDEAGNPIPFSLVRGTRVRVCYRADKVVVFVMAQQRKVGNAAK